MRATIGSTLFCATIVVVTDGSSSDELLNINHCIVKIPFTSRALL